MPQGWRGLGRKLRWSVAQRGWLGTLTAVVHRGHRQADQPAGPHPFDLQFGTDTGGLIGGGDLAVGSRNDAHITAYVGVPPSRFREALRRWAATLPAAEDPAQFTFVDLGCGKGRALLLAGEWPFRRVLGVELNPELAVIARRNLELWPEPLPSSEIVCGDAAELPYPPGPLLLFVYNAFGPPVVRSVLAALQRHVEQTGARVDLLFQNESPETPTRADPRLCLLWRAVLPIAEEEGGAELAASPEDITSLYRVRINP